MKSAPDIRSTENLPEPGSNLTLHSYHVTAMTILAWFMGLCKQFLSLYTDFF